jgi:hypothetical protein
VKRTKGFPLLGGFRKMKKTKTRCGNSGFMPRLAAFGNGLAPSVLGSVQFIFETFSPELGGLPRKPQNA